MPKHKTRSGARTTKRMFDETPDTSRLGEYSNRAKTEYAIDRKHLEDCITQTYNQLQARKMALALFRRLCDQLHALGFSKRAINAAYRNIEREDN